MQHQLSCSVRVNRNNVPAACRLIVPAYKPAQTSQCRSPCLHADPQPLSRKTRVHIYYLIQYFMRGIPSTSISTKALASFPGRRHFQLHKSCNRKSREPGNKATKASQYSQKVEVSWIIRPSISLPLMVSCMTFLHSRVVTEVLDSIVGLQLISI